MKKNTVLLYICIAIFGALGIYLTFVAGNTDKYDSQAKAYDIVPNEHYDSDDGTTYQPIYYFRVAGKDYECKAKMSSSSYPKKEKNTVYYDSKNPTNCKTEYEKSSSKFAGIILLIITAIMVYFFIIKKPSDNEDNYNKNQVNNIETLKQYDQEKVEKIMDTIDKVQLIYKRVIIGVIILILLVIIIIDSFIFKQTMVAKDYPEVTATFVNKIEDGNGSFFDNCVYTFVDKQGKQQEIIRSISKDDVPEEKIRIKYNENNPQDYYEEGTTMDKTGMIWYIVKIVGLVLLIALFCNKKLLSKIHILIGK